jgi:hypothetical protein
LKSFSDDFIKTDKFVFQELAGTLAKQQEIYINNIEGLKQQIHKYFGEQF